MCCKVKKFNSTVKYRLLHHPSHSQLVSCCVYRAPRYQTITQAWNKQMSGIFKNSCLIISDTNLKKKRPQHNWATADAPPAGGVQINLTHLSLHWWKLLWTTPPCGSLHPAGPLEPSLEPGWAADTPGSSSCRSGSQVGSKPRAQRRGTHETSVKKQHREWNSFYEPNNT